MAENKIASIDIIAIEQALWAYIAEDYNIFITYKSNGGKYIRSVNKLLHHRKEYAIMYFNHKCTPEQKMEILKNIETINENIRVSMGLQIFKL